jgi:hypothetical protein
MATKRYVLSSEIEKIRSKHPNFELQLPPVLYTDADRDGDGNLPEGVDVGHERVAGEILKVPSAALMSDEVTYLSRTDPIAAGRLLLGSEKYDRYALSGGTAQILFTIVNEDAGATAGE